MKFLLFFALCFLVGCGQIKTASQGYSVSRSEIDSLNKRIARLEKGLTDVVIYHREYVRNQGVLWDETMKQIIHYDTELKRAHAYTNCMVGMSNKNYGLSDYLLKSMRNECRINAKILVPPSKLKKLKGSP
ncbi:MAG: hypothetical protein OXC40_03805 [Proteobacteria bacterium]|nr:hypothetical protein [Pseudomonadota bacterium]